MTTRLAHVRPGPTPLGVRPGPTSPVIRPPHRRRARRAATAGLVVAVLLVLAVAGWGSVRSGAAPSAVGGAGVLTAADGWAQDGESWSPFDRAPAITRLDPALRTAVQEASVAASAAGLPFHVTTGWRSAAYQQSLYAAAVALYGSPGAARAHVLPPDESAHVTGDAVDVGPVDAMDWLSRHGADQGLCQTYANEMWHFELATAPGGTCPEQLADAGGLPRGSRTP